MFRRRASGLAFPFLFLRWVGLSLRPEKSAACGLHHAPRTSCPLLHRLAPDQQLGDLPGRLRPAARAPAQPRRASPSRRSLCRRLHPTDPLLAVSGGRDWAQAVRAPSCHRLMALGPLVGLSGS